MYCTYDDIQGVMPAKVLEELSNSLPSNTTNTVIVEAKIEEATALIDSYLANKYVLPLSSNHTLLKSICIDITVHKLYRLKGLNSYEASFKDAIALLKEIVSGEMKLIGEKHTIKFLFEHE